VSEVGGDEALVAGKAYGRDSVARGVEGDGARLVRRVRHRAHRDPRRVVASDEHAGDE